MHYCSLKFQKPNPIFFWSSTARKFPHDSANSSHQKLWLYTGRYFRILFKWPTEPPVWFTMLCELNHNWFRSDSICRFHVGSGWIRFRRFVKFELCRIFTFNLDIIYFKTKENYEFQIQINKIKYKSFELLKKGNIIESQIEILIKE